MARNGELLGAGPAAPTMPRREGRSDPASYPRPVVAWSAIAILFLATLSSQLDRQLPALLVRPLKTQFGFSNTGFGFLQGYAFALVYTFAGLPLGWLVDRSQRRNLLLLGLLVWSATTALSALAQTGTQLMLSRMGVGLGEAVLAPAAYSMIADLVPEDRRGRALSVYYVALAIGSGASLLLGGLILQAVPKTGLTLPGLAPLAPWRAAFLIAGAPGLLLALPLLAVREPRRQADLRRRRDGARPALLQRLRRRPGAYSSILTYPAIVALIGYAVLAWAPSLYQTRFGLEAKTAGVVLGAVVAAGGLAGTLCSGWLSDRWRARGLPAARLRVAVAAFLVILPGLAGFIAAPTLPVSLLCLGLAVAGFSMAQAAAPAVIAEITPNRLRGQAVAVYLLLGGLVGIGLGPLLVGFALDHIPKGPAAVPLALTFVGAPAALLGLAVAAAGLAPFQRALEGLARDEADQADAGSPP